MKTLMIVDDNVFDREGLASRMDWESLEIELIGTAKNGEEGCALARSMKPDIILTDIVMPIMDGLEMAERIRSERPGTRLVFMSSYDEFDYAKAAVDIGADSYIMKPVVLEELTKVLRRTCEALEAMTHADRLQEELRERLKESMPILQENFLREAAFGRIVAGTDPADQAAYLAIPLDKPYIAILAQLDEQSESTGRAGRSENHYIDIELLRSALSEEFTVAYNDFFVAIDENSLLVVHFFDENVDALEERENAIEACERARETFAVQPPKTATLGISQVETPRTRLQSAYAEVERAVRSRFFSKGNRLILSEDVPTEAERHTFSPEGIGDGIGALLDGVGQNPASFVQEYLPQGRLLEEGFVRSFSYVFLVHLQQQLKLREIRFQDVVPDEQKIWEKISRFETIPDIRNWMVNLLETAHRKAEERSSHRTNAIVRDIRKILDAEYATVQEIAQVTGRLYISVRYANAIFRKETGTTIGDYLFKQRMQAAKRLLEDPYCRIYEVSKKVGYGSPSYFSSAFKEYAGLTPREYRERHCGRTSI